MPNIVINGFGYRRTGTVVRPQITLVTPLDTRFQAVNVLGAEIVPMSVFTVEIESVGELVTDFEFRDTLNPTAEIEERDLFKGGDD